MLPQWSAFTGMDSILHYPIGALTLSKAGTHPITDGLPDQVRLASDELYIALSQTSDSLPLYYGQTAKGDSQPVVWVRREGKAEVVGITLGHDQNTWTHEFFWQILAQSVRYLTQTADFRAP
jgi:type 1 glutamine amidotransferase